MSASDNVELARKLYGTPEEGSYRGYQQARRHLTELTEPFEDVGRVVRLRAFFDREEALHAAGLQ
jgi:hypothetical protein